MSLSEIRSRFILVRKISASQVFQFLDIVNNWIYCHLMNRLELLSQSELSILDEMIVLYGCLSNAPLLRGKPDFRSKVVEYLKDLKPEEASNDCKILTSTIFYLVEGNETELLYAERVVASLPNGQVTIDEYVTDELFYHLYRLQDSKYFTPGLSCRFWSMISVILAKCKLEELSKILLPAELEAMSCFANLRFYPLIRVLFNNIMANLDTPLPVLFQVLKQFLLLWGVDFWKKADECHFSFIVETVPSNPHFKRRLQSGFQVEELVSWILPFINSLSGSQKQIAAVKLANFLILLSSESKFIRPLPVDLFMSCIGDQIDKTLNPSSLLKLRDIRNAVEKNFKYFIHLTRTAESPENAQNLIRFCLHYDISVNAHNAILIDGKEVPSLSESNNMLWEELRHASFWNLQLATKILESFSDASQIIIFKEKKNDKISRELEAAVKIHERDARSLNRSINAILEKLTLFDPEDLKVFLSSNKCVQSVWSCIFNAETSSTALSIISQIKDTEGRYEAIFCLLETSLKLNLRTFCNCISVFSSLKLYEPCPKTLRILMDVIKALADPLNGILSTQAASHYDAKNEIKTFWKCTWLFLVMIYKETLVWANYYHLSGLIEFTRDTLDTSHLLLDSFRVLLDFFGDNSLVGPLFEPFMTTFTHVIVWLRLGDLSLLKSCVELVFKGFDLAKELDVKVDQEFIIAFAKYGAKAKRFNNKLSEQQRDMILAKASEFDARLVSYVVEEAAKERSVSRLASPAISQSPAAVENAKFKYQTKPRELKQVNLARFGVVTSKPPVAPPPPQPFMAKNLEAIRNELKNSRNTARTPTISPAPARPAGFNNKSPVVGRSLNTIKHKVVDSDSSEDEDDVDTSDLFCEAKKKAKIIEVDFNGRAVSKVAAARKIDIERKEEERMRLRLSVNLKPLYSTVLRWNYNGNCEYPTEDRDLYKPKADIYTSAEDYTNAIEPLLMLECWQGIQASRSTGQELAFELLVGSRTTCDGFFDVYVSMKRAVSQQHKISDSDLIVLGYVADQGLTDPRDIANHLKKLSCQTCLGKVRVIKYANSDYCDLTIRVYPQGLMMGLLTPKSIVVGMKVCQMTTIEREYSSLKGISYYDLCNNILAAEPAPPVTISKERTASVCKKLGVNASQAQAIIGSSQREGFSLIQGPPGTGKTKTILGIVGHFLSKTDSKDLIAVSTPSTNNATALPEAKPVAKVLICAPSNAAVDELVIRLKDGVFKESGEKYVPKVIRLGRSDAMNASVRDLSLEELVERHLKERNDQVFVNPNIRQEHNKCLAERNRIRKELKGDLKDDEILKLEKDLKEINKKRNELGKLLDEQREKVSVAVRSREIERRQMLAKLISEAQVICSTLSGSAHDFLASMYMKFDQVIIDEACQCVELSAIIPLRYGCKKCVMVGDPNQLPPTVLSQRAASLKYEESLFIRMQKNHPDLVYLLDVQYRMHPEISKFPSFQFYHSRLKDGAGMLEKNTRPWHSNPILSPYRFFGISSHHIQNESTRSFYNRSESMVALELVEKLMEIFPGKQFSGKVGIISPYKEQIRSLRDIFQRKLGANILHEIDFNTVDGFQGQEKEIIIMSCVRASETGSVGFLSDVRRMNVALTRARSTLWVLGNKESLSRDKVWRKLIENAESRKCLTNARPGFLSSVRSLPDEIMLLPPKLKTPQQYDDCFEIPPVNIASNFQTERKQYPPSEKISSKKPTPTVSEEYLTGTRTNADLSNKFRRVEGHIDLLDTMETADTRKGSKGEKGMYSDSKNDSFEAQCEKYSKTFSNQSRHSSVKTNHNRVQNNPSKKRPLQSEQGVSFHPKKIPFVYSFKQNMVPRISSATDPSKEKPTVGNQVGSGISPANASNNSSSVSRVIPNRSGVVKRPAKPPVSNIFIQKRRQPPQ